MPSIHKVLVANRGEIAARIIRSLKEMNIATVAIYSEADRTAPHVMLANQAVCIGKAPSSESYLNQQNIVDVCLELQVDAVHPGYGFLSENADFADLTEQNGIIFIGPSRESIEVMGSKIKAKEAVAGYNIPLVPGTTEPVTPGPHAQEQAAAVGYPLLIKASAGGGGKGMRVVEAAEEFDSQLQRASSEALSAFGDGSVFIEKFITEPRHIEVQILGDQHGNIVHLYERECSIQRRHQKVIEEAPSTAISAQLRQQLGQAAVDVAKAAGYYGAGTVEFMLDQHKNFYFLEMNTRLQVEHPITEMITGIDLVKEQVRVAEGKKLPFDQGDIKITGHAIEARVYAEDPSNNFLPDTGKLHYYQIPRGPGVRVDDGYYQGMEVPIYYDPMIAKLIVHGKNRVEAIQRMIRSIDEYRVVGLKTTLDFCRFVMQHPKFEQGDYNTGFVGEHYRPEEGQNLNQETQEVAAAFAAYISSQKKSSSQNHTGNQSSDSAWRSRAKDAWNG
ncbi:MAG: acetyl-CoA carboxylase biotin carboxylase subunit [Cyclobacteriaceae bacterium]|nr:MAG: acetyl-CoA carboxylase biotin carboxylase subunit [Cyclobacteriaceae bacterium]